MRDTHELTRRFAIISPGRWRRTLRRPAASISSGTSPRKNWNHALAFAKTTGADKELPLAIGREVLALFRDPDRTGIEQRSSTQNEDKRDTPLSVAEFLLKHPEHRYAVRVQTAARFHSEIHDNLIGAQCRPIDMLRFKLAFFGATKFDPKSDRWTRITLFQGAPPVSEVNHNLQQTGLSDLRRPR